MNKIQIISSSLGIALLLASAAPALADEGSSSEDSMNVHATTSVRVGDQEDGQHRPLFAFPKFRFMASTTAHVEKDNDRDEDNASSTPNQGMEKRIEKASDKAAVSIDNRIEALQKLSDRLASIKLLPADVLAKLQTSITSEIQALTALKSNLSTTTATSTAQADLKALAKVTHEHLFAEPKARIAAAASRINAVVTQLGAFATKLDARITEAKNNGVDVTTATTALADLKAKIADAKTQADAAVSLTASLSTSGDAAANKATLKDASQKLVTAQKDLAAARHDAATVIGIVKKKDNNGQNATTTATTTP